MDDRPQERSIADETRVKLQGWTEETDKAVQP